jgi:hypothetical protein
MPAQFTTGAAVTTSGSLSSAWNSVPDKSWFGNVSGAAAAPIFINSPFPVALIPSLPASQITSGVFALPLLPVAVGVGSTHAPGLVPDPGASGTISDYLARDMTYKPIPVIPTVYQPTVGTPSLASSGVLTGPISVSVTLPTAGSTAFYSTTAATGPFTEISAATMYFSLAPLATAWVYAAKAGYTNSTIATITNPNPS